MAKSDFKDAGFGIKIIQAADTIQIYATVYGYEQGQGLHIPRYVGNLAEPGARSLHGLTLSAFLYPERKSVGSAAIEYENIGTAGYAELKAKVAVLEKIIKGMNALSERFGETENFLNVVARVSDVMGFKHIWVYKESKRWDWNGWMGYEFPFGEALQEAQFWIDRIFEEYGQAQTEASGVAA